MQRLYSVLLVMLISASFTPAYSQYQVRKKINFDEGWKFHLGHAADPLKDFNFKIANIFSKSGGAPLTAIDPKFQDSGWRSLQLPHDWAVESPFENSLNFNVMAHGYKPVGGLFPATSIGWYRKHFNIASKDSGQRFQIQFDGVFRDASFWVNGFYLGNNQSGYIGAAYDITDYINFDKENVLVVRADATQYEGWFYEGAGIYRHVWLNAYSNVHLAHDGVFVHTTTQGNQATVTVEATVENQNFSIASCTVSAYVTDRDGRILATTKEQPVLLEANASASIKQKLTLLNPRLWSVGNPYLYRIVPVIKVGDKVVDTDRIRFGVRTINIDKNGVFLNGQYVKIKGTNNHQDHAGVGSALPDYLQYYRIRLLKDMGSNAYRTSHNAPTPELLDACDSLGMLVMDEQRLLNSSPEYINQFERLIQRDRNHASVFMWSIGNEEGWLHTTSVGKRVALSLLAIQKQFDPTRTSTYAADLGNVYEGVNEVVPVRGFNYRHAAISDYHKDHPDQPILGTEMGSTVTTRGIYVKDTVAAYVPDQDITAPWWASTAEAWWPLAAENKWMLGGFIWTGLDYRGEPTPYEWPNINSHFGIMDICGFPKNLYYYYQSWWSDKDVLHISPHWNWKGKEGQPIDVWVNSNADIIELFLNGKSQGKKNMPRNSHLKWSVPYKAGKLEAIGYTKGRKLEAKIETTGDQYTVVATPHKTTILADGKDATVINISVVDKQGRIVPDANNLISFLFEGDAKIIGVGNGDPSSHEPDKYFDDRAWERKLFNGHCQVILQGGKTQSVIQFEARSTGLQTGSTSIQTIQAGETRPAVEAFYKPTTINKATD